METELRRNRMISREQDLHKRPRTVKGPKLKTITPVEEKKNRKK